MDWHLFRPVRCWFILRSVGQTGVQRWRHLSRLNKTKTKKMGVLVPENIFGASIWISNHWNMDGKQPPPLYLPPPLRWSWSWQDRMRKALRLRLMDAWNIRHIRVLLHSVDPRILKEPVASAWVNWIDPIWLTLAFPLHFVHSEPSAMLKASGGVAALRKMAAGKKRVDNFQWQIQVTNNEEWEELLQRKGLIGKSKQTFDGSPDSMMDDFWIWFSD